MLISATAVLLAWLVVAVTRVTLGDLHLPRLHASPLQPSTVEGRAEPTPPPVPAEPTPPPVPAEPTPPAVPAEPSGARETQLYDEWEAERAVREHLYGRRGTRMTRAPRN